MSQPLLLTFNAGSSTVKLGLFAIRARRAGRLAGGVLDLRHAPLVLQFDDQRIALNGTPETMLADMLAAIDIRFDLSRLAVAGHRVVHGGEDFAGPARIDPDSLAAIEALVPRAPLHQPASLRLIHALRAWRPALMQTASFDTAFHRQQADEVCRFAIPRALHAEGIRRYGFHGLSYASIAATLARRAPALAAGRVVVAHLGSGASLCALEAGVSRDSSMGFSTLDGIPMATRPGALDPGVLLHLLGPGGQTLAAVEEMLNRHSGLLGMSGLSADSRDLLASDRPEARQALDVFTFRISGEVARLATTLGGLDALVFTAGIGEHQPAIRAAVCARLAWLGVVLDDAANAANAETISAAGSRIAVLVLQTDEEQVVADEALSLLREEGA
ncbi:MULTISPECIES: acetate/propionate family kinase [Roseomonadaceae]|uniref:Acetate kinase n=1 Tax=Falsiroseomonas oleicola TaxID=2801474 RepID=A0ABS6H4I2_9PROT|nr:acetate/propionate family kinase [Roseomonas oleicola]MBU8542742.1 acetate/propionate family kinase [Roseomonas oleicola]